ncbi:chromosome segregation protein SMC [Enterococcus sp. CSURQ0835]|uniref:chromosome segregation protein SMC n=1 Tax=Enterococcus sp. CSURQ0835 TaxID=2681394 RepID=UPI00135A7CB3|nr:chromosome segregation protein SMC [Enterococcus sp. CSURQ0835]
MYLKRIELAGFKSFADRTKIEFEPGVTAVIGPNGSGKSNITEAIRWVLGEQSAKNLRGGKMPDIIFAGSDSRKPLNLAEVTVVLDNTDHYLPLDFSEVSVTRRYRRSGESDFFINKKACRLKDIQELFLDSGLGKESFSIISQGKVEAIFSSKPEDRRGIFEEAAGVLKYKQRKKKAEQKLFETEDNLNRVQDIIYELEDQLTPLAAQSAAAKEFLALKAQLQEQDVNLTVQQIKQTKQTWQAHCTQLKELQTATAQQAQKVKQAEAKLTELRHTRDHYDVQLERQQQDLLTLTERVKQTEGQKELLQERSKNTQKSSSEYRENQVQVQLKHQQATEKLAELTAQHAQTQKEKSALQQQVTQLAKEAEKYQRSTKEVIEELRGTYVDLMQEQATTSNELKYLEKQYVQETAKNTQASQRFEQLQHTRAELTASLQAVQQENKTSTEQLKTTTEMYQQVLTDMTQTEERLQSAQQKMYEQMNQLQQSKAKLKSLQAIQASYSGFYQGVRTVLKQRTQLTGIVGAVAELIEVPAKFTLAIETALGAAAQHVIVQDEASARRAIQFLKQQRGGRATFLPLTTIKSRQLTASLVARVEQLPGYLGIASQLIEFPANLSQVMENLLGTIVIAQDLESANALAKALNYQVRVVSLTGDVMNAGGSMTGGASRNTQNNLLNQTQELDALQHQVATADQALQQQEQHVRQLQQQIKMQKDQSETLRSTGEELRFTVKQQQTQQAQLEQELKRVKQEQQLFAYEAKELETFLADYETQKNALTQRQSELVTEQSKIDQEIKQLTEESDLLAEKRAAIAQQLSQLQAELAVKTEQVTHLAQQVVSSKFTITELEQQIASLDRQLQALSSDVSTHEETEESLSQRLAELSEQKQKLTETVAQMKTERNQTQATVTQLDQELTQLNEEQKQLLAEQSQVDVKKNRLELQLDQQLDYLQTEYSVTFEKAAADATEVADFSSAQQQVQQLKARLAKLGPVNLTAIEQAEQVSERYDFLTTQRDDLISAKEQLFETMDEMDDEVKTRFYQTFQAIRQKFTEVFPQMFGGGQAELILTAPDDLLNTGIEIEAQPPGKKLQSLSLLSGGERALTAITLLFAIIQVRPVPFCVLDEVEAALDEANVNRFGRYLSAFQNETQFIVVTHRKGTMEAADALYGVTMQESGVSSVISVRLEEAKELGEKKG